MQMNKVKAIVLDFDDTLVYSGEAGLQSLQKTAKGLELCVPEKDEIFPLFGKPLQVIVETLWPKQDSEEIQKVYRKHYDEVDIEVITNAIETLQLLKKRKYDLFILSSNKDVEKHMEKMNFPAGLFSGIFTPNNLEFNKPDGRVFSPILEKYAKEEIVYVGDSLNDLESSKDAGIKFIGVLSGRASETEFRENSSTHIIPSVENLKELFGDEYIKLPTEFGQFVMKEFEIEGRKNYVLVKGDLAKKDVLVRVHSECFTSEVLGSLRCDCREQLHSSLRLIEKNGEGILIYLRQEGRGIGLSNKLKAYKLQDQGMDTIEANEELGFEVDSRDYSDAVSILNSFGIDSVRLLTNNPAKISSLEEKGIVVSEIVQMKVLVNEHNSFYLQTKKDKMGHLLW